MGKEGLRRVGSRDGRDEKEWAGKVRIREGGAGEGEGLGEWLARESWDGRGMDRGWLRDCWGGVGLEMG